MLRVNSVELIEEFSVVIEIEDKMKFIINTDLIVVDADVLKKISLDFSNTDMSLETGVKVMEVDGSTCN